MKFQLKRIFTVILTVALVVGIGYFSWDSQLRASDSDGTVTAAGQQEMAEQTLSPVQVIITESDEMVIVTSDAKEPAAEEPVAEEPVVEEPAVEEPVAEEAVTEEPVVEEPAVEEAVTEEPAVEEPVTEEAVTEEPAVEEPVTEEAVTEELAVEEPVAEEVVTEERAVEEPVTEEAVTEEPVVEEPVTEEPVTEEPAVEEPVTEEPVTEELAVEEPAVEEIVEEEPIDPLINASVRVWLGNEGELYYGDTAVLYATVRGVPDDVSYTIQWQTDYGKGWVNIPGETGESYRFVMTRQNVELPYRAVLICP